VNVGVTSGRSLTLAYVIMDVKQLSGKPMLISALRYLSGSRLVDSQIYVI